MSTATAPAPLVELLDLIQANVKVVISEYAAINQVVPSLDSLVPGPFDTPESVTPQLSEAIRIIEAACAQLSFTIASPGHVVTNVSRILLRLQVVPFRYLLICHFLQKVYAVCYRKTIYGA